MDASIAKDKFIKKPVSAVQCVWTLRPRLSMDNVCAPTIHTWWMGCVSKTAPTTSQRGSVNSAYSQDANTAQIPTSAPPAKTLMPPTMSIHASAKGIPFSQWTPTNTAPGATHFIVRCAVQGKDSQPNVSSALTPKPASSMVHAPAQLAKCSPLQASASSVLPRRWCWMVFVSLGANTPMDAQHAKMVSALDARTCYSPSTIINVSALTGILRLVHRGSVFTVKFLSVRHVKIQ